MGLCDGELQCLILSQEEEEEEDWKCMLLLPQDSGLTDKLLHTYDVYIHIHTYFPYILALTSNMGSVILHTPLYTTSSVYITPYIK